MTRHAVAFHREMREVVVMTRTRWILLAWIAVAALICVFALRL